MYALARIIHPSHERQANLKDELLVAQRNIAKQYTGAITFSLNCSSYFSELNKFLSGEFPHLQQSLAINLNSICKFLPQMCF